MEIGLNWGEQEVLQFARVKRRAVDEDGKTIGIPSNNTILDSWQFEIEYVDGNTVVLNANIIAENLMAQVDDHGNRQLLINEIEYHQINKEAIQHIIPILWLFLSFYRILTWSYKSPDSLVCLLHLFNGHLFLLSAGVCSHVIYLCHEVFCCGFCSHYGCITIHIFNFVLSTV